MSALHSHYRGVFWHEGLWMLKPGKLWENWDELVA